MSNHSSSSTRNPVPTGDPGTGRQAHATASFGKLRDAADASGTSFASYLGDVIRANRIELTRQWVQELEQQLGVEPTRVLPSEDLLNHIPEVLQRVADFVSDPEARLLETLVVEDLGRLTDLRRRQGYGLQELLREYHILSELIQRSIETATEDYGRSVHPLEVVRPVGRLKDAIHLLSAVTARSFRVWTDRYDQERREIVEAYGKIVAHELGNRLGAAGSAAKILVSDIPISDDRRTRLLRLIEGSLSDGLQTIRDVSVLAEPVSVGTEGRSMDLRLLLNESVRLAAVANEESGLRIDLVDDVPTARVPGPPLRLAVSNLLSNAVKHHRPPGENRWVRVGARRLEGDDATIEVWVEDNGPGIPADSGARIFEYRYRGNVDQEGSGLGLAITREALERVGGTVAVEAGSEDGARFVVRVPEMDGADTAG